MPTSFTHRPRAVDFKAKMRKIRFSLGLRHIFPALFEGPTSKRREGKGGNEEGEEKWKEGKGKGGREGRGGRKRRMKIVM